MDHRAERTTEQLSVLIIEDSEADAELITRQLDKACFTVSRKVVDNPEALRSALRERAWDVVLADFSLPTFDAYGALGILREVDPDTPFIVVSGVIGDERAIELMRLGARDYVLKDNLARLPAAVDREVREARQRAERRAAEEALRRSEESRALLATALDSATTPIAICNSRGITVWINTAFTSCTGFTADEALGRSLRELIDSGRNDDSIHISQVEALQAGRPWVGEMINQRKDGTVYPDYVTLTPVRGDAGGITHFIAIMHDLSEQKRQEEGLKLSQRLESIGQLTGGIAHDFNNLLTVILGNAELLNMQLRDDTGLRPLAAMICTAAERAADLTRSLMAFARQQELEPQVVDVNRLIKDMEGLLCRTLGEDIEIRIVAAPRLPPVLIDPTQLESALLNLCLNGRDAMPAGGQLTIETAPCHLGADDAGESLELVPGEYVMVSVTDVGCGIRAEHLARVFEPFFTTKDKSKGTGLGLPRVYGFIKQSGGQINIESEVDRGTCVKMYVPCTAAN
ncbi:MAG TPA: ATP-binding protein [Gammaproteobacteria bacterium]|nr:ATP-binding protein [Gammaproteobacteria bacterium]